MMIFSLAIFALLAWLRPRIALGAIVYGLAILALPPTRRIVLGIL